MIMPATRPTYWSAAVCRRGHVATDILDRHPVEPHCERCGADIFKACPTCGGRIRGARYGVVTGQLSAAPDFCGACGSVYSWTTREGLVYAIENKLDSDADLSDIDRELLRKRIQVLSQDPSDSAKIMGRWIDVLKELAQKSPSALKAALPVLVQILEVRKALSLGS